MGFFFLFVLLFQRIRSSWNLYDERMNKSPVKLQKAKIKLNEGLDRNATSSEHRISPLRI